MITTAPRTIVMALAIGCAGVGAAGCGSSSESSPSATASVATPLALQGSEYTFSGPTTVSAGLVDIRFQNTGKETHEAQLISLDPGHSLNEVITAASQGNTQPPTWAHGVGGPSAIDAGASSAVTEVLAPGTYYFLCFVSGSDKVPHLVKGMHSTLTVSGTAAGASLPSSSGTVVANEYSFTVPSLKAGNNTLAVRNDGPAQLHEWGLVKLQPGFTVDKLKQALSSPGGPPPGPPPFTDVGGVAAYDPAGTATFSVSLESGASYAFLCFVPDRAGTGPPVPHAARGMVAGVTVGS